MSVDNGRERTDVPRESLGEKKVAGCSVHVGDGGVAQGVERVEAVEACFDMISCTLLFVLFCPSWA